MERDKLKRQAEVIDMMVTVHSVLASRYQRRTRLLEIFLMGVSTVLVALTFFDPQIIPSSIPSEKARILIGICSIIIFFISLVALIVDWKGRATRHRQAFNALVSLKSEWRDFLAFYEDGDDSAAAAAEFARRSALIGGNLIPIPDSQFNRLKAFHHKKVVLSKMISAHPGSSAWVLRIRVWWRGILKAFRANFPDEG